MIYLDNAATSYPKPEGLIPLLEHYLLHQAGNPGRSGHPLSLAAAEAIYETRTLVANFIGCASSENIIFTQNATFSINTAIRARVSPNDHILISDLEHNSVFRPVWKLARDGLVTYSVFSHRGNIIKNLTDAIRPNTRMLICTHVSNVTGFEMPIYDIIKICQRHGIFSIIDASQSIGHQPIDVGSIGCDALCAPGHKGLLGLQGSGILYLKEKNGLRDVFQGGSGADSLSPAMPAYLPDKFEAGTLPTPAILSMANGIRYIKERGIDRLHAHERHLSALMHDYIAKINGARLYSTPHSGIVAFQLFGKTSDEVADALASHGICVRGGYHCAPLAHRAIGTLDGGVVRLSIGAFNTEDDILYTALCIQKIAKR